MFDIILHFLGICPDHLTHLNFLDLLIFGPLTYLSVKAKSIYYNIKKIFTHDKE